MLGTGENKTQTLIIPALTRKTVNVAEQVGINQDVSCKIVSSDTPIVAERPMYFNYHNFAQDGTCVFGSNSPQRFCYFAEGNTFDNFQEWITIQNPNPTDAKVDITYYTSEGDAPIQVQKTVPAKSRYTVNVLTDVGAYHNVSAKLTSSVPIVAERPMYFSYENSEGQKFGGGSDVMGITKIGNLSFFAEGTTIQGFDTWYTIGNPQSTNANVKITYIFSGGIQIVKDYVAPANSRLTLKVNDEVGAGKDVSARIESNQNIVIERPMYFDYDGGIAGGDVVSSYVVDTAPNVLP